MGETSPPRARPLDGHGRATPPGARGFFLKKIGTAGLGGDKPPARPAEQATTLKQTERKRFATYGELYADDLTVASICPLPCFGRNLQPPEAPPRDLHCSRLRKSPSEYVDGNLSGVQAPKSWHLPLLQSGAED